MKTATNNYGPLTAYIGTWTGSGIDTVPDGKGGKTETPFIQELRFEAAPFLSYSSQQVCALRYSCIDWAVDNNAESETMFPVFEERGYLIWVAEEGKVILQVSNPRGLSMLAIGSPEADSSLSVTTQIADSRYGVLVSDYIETVEVPIAYEASLKFNSDDKLHYRSNTILEMPDGSIFNQTDITDLQRY